MNNIKEYIRKIVDEGSIEDMHKLSDILNDVIEIVKEYDENCFTKYKMMLYKMAYGETLNMEFAKDIVQKMKPYGMRWDIEETENMQRQYGLNNISPVDFYVVVNSAYNDFKDLFDENVEMYIRYANDFINDEDAKQGKVFKYFTIIPE